MFRRYGVSHRAEYAGLDGQAAVQEPERQGHASLQDSETAYELQPSILGDDLQLKGIQLARDWRPACRNGGSSKASPASSLI